MGSAFHQLCPRYSGTLTPTAPTAIRLWDTLYPYAPNFGEVEGHIALGLPVRLCTSLPVRKTFWQLGNSRTAYAGILKFYLRHVHEK